MDFSRNGFLDDAFLELTRRFNQQTQMLRMLRATAYSPGADADPAVAVAMFRDVFDRFDRQRAAEFEKASR